MKPQTITLAKQQLRGYWLTNFGQRVIVWIPPGRYMVGGPAGGIVALIGDDGRAWHVGERAIAGLATVGA